MAGKNVGNLSAILSLSTSALASGFNRAKALVGGFASSINRVGSALASPMGALAGAVAIGSITAGLKSVADEIDNTAKTADRLNITTEALIGLRHASELSGLSAEGFDNAMTTMARNIGNAMAGNKKAQASIKALGFDLDALANVSPENQLKAIADQLDKVTDANTKLSLATKIFGGDGAKMINVLQGGSAALEAAQKEAEELGLTFSRIDAAKVEAANDSISRMMTAIKAVGQAIVIQLAPYIDAAANRFTEWSKSGQSWGSMIVNAVEWVATAIAYVSDTVDLVSIAWSGLKFAALKSLEFILDAISNTVDGVHNLVELFGDLLPESVTKGLDATKNSIDKFANGISAMAETAGKEFDEKMLQQSASDKVGNFFAKIKSEAQAAAEETAKNAPKPEEFVKPVYGGLLSMSSDISDQFDKAKKDAKEIQRTSFGNNDLIRAGSSQAQSLRGQNLLDQTKQYWEKQFELKEREIEVAEETRDAVQELVDSTDDESEVAEIY